MCDCRNRLNNTYEHIFAAAGTDLTTVMNTFFLENWIHTAEKAEVAFVSAPVSFPPLASISLSIFQASLDEAGISSKIIYTMFPAIYMLGEDYIYELNSFIDITKHGEVLFAHLTDANACGTLEELAAEFAPPGDDARKERLLELLKEGTQMASALVDAAARKILALGAKVVAVSSIFLQQNASLAIIKRVKELDPSISTILGGFNVTGEMGMAVLHHYPSVDYVSFGEGDETIVEVCEILLGRKSGPLPYGLLKHGCPDPEKIPYRMTKDMNLMPVPDYRDFFEEVRKEESGIYGKRMKYYGESFNHAVFLEGSRGCWWGAKHACSFCGLNGLNNVYREKTPERLHEEIREITRRYPNTRIQLTDNVLSRNMIRRLPPLLEKDETDYRIAAEIKTNLNSAQMKSLAAGGIIMTQPGIESLNDHLLDLMGKGGSAVQNIAILKYARTYDIKSVWNMLCGIPGEEREDYEQMLELIPLLSHLAPPIRKSMISFVRFSRYSKDPDSYGLNLVPKVLYQWCYKKNPDLIRNMGIYYMTVDGSHAKVRAQNRDLYDQMENAVKAWQTRYFSSARPVLTAVETLLGLSICDTRPCAVQDRFFLVGLAARVYRLAFEPVSFEQLRTALPDVSEKDLKICLNKLEAQKILVYLSEKYLALAILVDPKEGLKYRIIDLD